ncbi:glycosyl hydrolase family 61-domain-containing protein [Trametes polyzona]|nr:glycosyl hydrolase family 61-domain-containing protein [Trametes polyzona]
MKLALLSVLAAAAISANAHFTMQYIWVNGVDQGQNKDIRVPPNNNPVTDVTSKDLTCNVNGLSGAGVSTVEIPAGSNITFEWHQHAQRTGEDAISGGHKGPVQVYIAKAPSTAASFDGQGTVWTKIYSSGLLNPQTQEWATDVVNANNGKHSVVIPSSLPAGEYLLRAEIIALHVAQSYPGAQFVSLNCIMRITTVVNQFLPAVTVHWYVGYAQTRHIGRQTDHITGCAQVKITGGGSANPPKIAIPGDYKSSDPGITVNIYNNLKSYTAPGGPVWSG